MPDPSPDGGWDNATEDGTFSGLDEYIWWHRDLSALPGTVMRQNGALLAKVRKLHSRICHLLPTPVCTIATGQELRRLDNRGTMAKGEC